MNNFKKIGMVCVALLLAGISVLPAQAASSWKIAGDKDVWCDEDFYGHYCVIDVTVSNLTKKVQNLSGTIYLRAKNNSVYGPVRSPNGICNANYVNNYWNPKQVSSWSYCFAVPRKTKIKEIFIANNPAAKAKVAGSFVVTMR